MTRRREDLIRELSTSPAVAPGAGAIEPRALRWLALATLLALVAIVLREPLREAPLARLLAEPRNALAVGMGLLAAVSAGLAAFRSGVPSPTSPLRQALWPVLFAAAWIGLLALGVLRGDGAATVERSRALCWLEVFAYGVPGLWLGLVAVRRLWPLHGAWSGALLGFAAGAIPALIMDFACINEPGHSLSFHVAPGLALAAVGALVGRRALRMGGTTG
jgi:hypothetical protein